MKRIVVSALVAAAAVCAVVLWMLLSPVRTSDGVACGSVALPVEPDPTAEREHGCGDVRRDRGGLTILVGILGGPLVVGVSAATAAATLSFAR